MRFIFETQKEIGENLQIFGHVRTYLISFWTSKTVGNDFFDFKKSFCFFFRNSHCEKFAVFQLKIHFFLKKKSPFFFSKIYFVLFRSISNMKWINLELS